MSVRLRGRPALVIALALAAVIAAAGGVTAERLCDALASHAAHTLHPSAEVGR